MILYTLPKIWQGRIKKYWDRTIPGDFPASKAKFDLKFDTQEEKDAVAKFEEELGTDESVVVKEELIPEGTFVSGSLGIYDVNGPGTEKILLNPEKVTTSDSYIVLHYEDEDWKVIEDTELIQGYIWGVVNPDNQEDDGEGLSPIAVVFYKKDIEVVSLDWFATPVVVANGNPITVTSDDNNHVLVINKNSGLTIDATEAGANYIAGGSADGSPIEKISISAYNVNNDKVRLCAGSFYYDEDKFTTVDSAEITVMDSVVAGITASVGSVRTNDFKVTVDNSKAMFIAAGQTTISKIGKDSNKSLEEISMSSCEWVKNASYDIKNSEITWFYTGGSSGYSYTVNAEATITNSNITGICAGGSNGRSDVVKYSLINVVTPSYISTNRGIVGSVSTKIKDSQIDSLAVCGDLDTECTGIVNEVAINVDAGKYTLILGKNDGKPVEDVSNIKYVKISRAADYTISQADLNKLGDKFIVK